MTDSSTQAVYEAARLGRGLSWGSRPAVLVVDLSTGFTDPEAPMGSDLSAVVSATRRLLDAARSGDTPVVFTTIEFDPGDEDTVLWMQKAPSLQSLVRDGGWTAIDPRLGRRPDETLVRKKGASAFFGTRLAEMLADLGVDTVILCGATTSGCIRATAIDLMQLGLPAVVPEAAVGDRAPEPHEANLVDIAAKYGDVVPLDAALAYLAGTATPPA